MAMAQKKKKPQISQKRASLMGVARVVTVRGRVARSAACMVDHGFSFQVRTWRLRAWARIARCL